MSVRAQWHLADLGLDTDDGSDPMSDLLKVAKPIDLSRDRAQLQNELASLLRAEGAVYERTGVRCALNGQARCSKCPHSRRHLKVDKPQRDICFIGLRQEQVIDQLSRHREIEELEAMAFDHLLRDECDELAEALLPDEAIAA